MSSNSPTSVLLVCLGNICRSPSAESVMRAKCAKAGLDIHLDSAGTANYHTGSPPDIRAIKVGQALGYDLSSLRARQVTTADFYDFDIIFAMDNHNLADLQKLKPADATATVQLFDNQAVADPYYGDEQDFRVMFDHITQVADRRVAEWQA